MKLSKVNTGSKCCWEADAETELGLEVSSEPR